MSADEVDPAVAEWIEATLATAPPLSEECRRQITALAKQRRS